MLDGDALALAVEDEVRGVFVESRTRLAGGKAMRRVRRRARAVGVVLGVSAGCWGRSLAAGLLETGDEASGGSREERDPT